MKNCSGKITKTSDLFATQELPKASCDNRKIQFKELIDLAQEESKLLDLTNITERLNQLDKYNSIIKGLELVLSAYQKPQLGIPFEDLSIETLNKINKLISDSNNLYTRDEIDRLLFEYAELIENINFDDVLSSYYSKAEIDNKFQSVLEKELLIERYISEANNKLTSISAVAQANVQSNWEETDTLKDSYIRNKPTIPTKTSLLINDLGFITEHLDISNKVDKITDKGLSTNDYTDEEKTKLSNIESGANVNVQADWNLTDVNADDYIKNKPSIAGSLVLSDWILTDSSNPSYIANKPTIPTNVSELNNDSGFITTFTETDPTVPSWAKEQNKPTYTANEVGALPDNTFIPTKVSDLNNDSGFLTQHLDISGKVNTTDLHAVAFSGSYNDLENKPTIPTIPTNVSSFTNDAGYLTLHLDISGKANSSDLHTVATSGDYNDLENKPIIPVIPTNVSTFTNDAGYLTLHQDISGKVDKINGKGLSTEDYTTAELTKLANIEAGAEVNVLSDWNQTDVDADDYIKNKPTIPAAQVNSDWNASSGVALILNKPSLATVATSGNYSDLNNTPTIPADLGDLSNNAGYSKTTGTVTGITMNSGNTISPDSNGVIDLGTVLTSHLSLKTINFESISGSGNIDVKDVIVGKLDNGDFYVGGYSTDLNLWLYLANAVSPEEKKVYADILNNKIYIYSGAEYIEIANKTVTDLSITSGSTNPVSGGAIYTEIQDLYTYINLNMIRKPVVVYETDGTSGILGVNNITLGTNWQLENYDFTPYTYLKCYIRMADLSTTSNYLTPAMVIELPLDAASKPQGENVNDMYIAGGLAACPSDLNQTYSVLIAVDSTKTKLLMICQNRIYGTAKTNSNNNGRYLYKIVGYYD